MTILYLTYDGLTDPLGRSQILPYLLGLANDKGFKFKVISFEKVKNYENEKMVVQDLIAPLNIQWIPLTYHKFPPVFSTIYDLFRLHRLAYELVDKESIDMVHCRSYLTALVGLAMKRSKGVKFIFDMRGFWADERLEGGIWNLKNPVFEIIYRYFKRKEKQFLQAADHVVVLTNKAQEIIERWEPKSDMSVTVIPCCVDMALFDPEKAKKRGLKRSTLGLRENDLVIVYHGSLGTWYMLDEMVRYFKYMRESHDNAKFLILTMDATKSILELCQHYKLNTQDLVIKAVTRDEVPAHLCLADFAIFFIRPVFSKQASSPTKSAELMSLGIPAICNSKVGDIAYFYEEGMGDLVDVEDENQLKASARGLAKIQVDRSKIMEICRKNFSLQIGIASYGQVYNSLS